MIVCHWASGRCDNSLHFVSLLMWTVCVSVFAMFSSMKCACALVQWLFCTRRILVLARRAAHSLWLIVGLLEGNRTAVLPPFLWIISSSSRLPSLCFCAIVLSDFTLLSVGFLLTLRPSLGWCDSHPWPLCSSTLSLTCDILTLCTNKLFGRTTDWLCLFILTTDELACWLVAEMSGFPTIWGLPVYPSAHVSHSVCLFSMFSPFTCQHSSLCSDQNVLSISFFTPPNLLSCTL